MTTTRSTSSKIQALILSLWTSRKLLRGPSLWRARRLCLGAESIRCVCLYVFEILGQVCSEGSSFCQVGRKRKAEHPLASTPSEAAPPVASEPAVHAARPPSLPQSWSAEFGEHSTSILAQPWTPPGSSAEASFGESWPAWTPPRTPLEHLDEELAQPWTPLGPPPTSPEVSRPLSPHWETPPEIHAAFRSQSAQAVSSSQSDALSSPGWRTPPKILEAFRQGL